MTDPASSFPHADLTPIVGMPSFAAVQDLKKQLIANAVSVYSPRGNGLLGHSVLILGQAAYDALAVNTPWIAPVNPGNAPIVVANSTQHQLLNTQHQWEREKAEWELYVATSNALKRLVIAAIDPTFISSLEDSMFGFTNVTVFQILTHLETTYAIVDQDALKANLDSLSAPWDPTETMEPLWQRGTLARRIAAAGQVPITDAQILLAYRDILKNTGLFLLDIRDWDKLPANQKTLATFQAAFTAANTERLKNLTSGQHFGTHQRVPGQAFAATGTRAGVPPSTPPLVTAGTFAANSSTQLAYCWTHGVSSNSAHTSHTCSRKGEGHQQNATIDDMMGGNNTIRRKPREKNIYLEKNPRRNAANGASGAPILPDSTDSQE
jgi:hypothetical protein